FDKNNKCSLNAPWLATMIGNLSVERELLIKIGLFDENFKSWGCEHFEIGYRFFKNMNLSFFRIIEAPSFHIAHRREEFFYENALKVSHNYFKSKHNDLSVQLLLPLLEGEITLGEFDTRLHKTPNNLNESINDVYVKNISRNN
ncbi:glycosyltransferase family 2 protein, partial [Metabacillus fastidiosus]|uniref:glycosyltransferase family 2 protein n=1 Tax=Metabacillus fastidiosus TaxID=1458 RepID=UPI003D2C33AC